MARRNYSVVEVEALIPSLEEIFSRILQLRIGLRALEKKLERAGVSVDMDSATHAATAAGDAAGEEEPEEELASAAEAADDASAEGDSVEAESPEGESPRGEGGAEISEAPGIRHAQAVFRGYYEALSDGLEEIRSMGGDVKDLDLGLVDFPGKRGNDDILLCWRLGEKRIEYWHTVEGGFANRRRLDERLPRTPSRAE
jgi:Uncharacterized conserved protein (DUF2203)